MDSNKIKQIMKEKRIYQWEVAKIMGITEFTLTRWLRDELSDEKYIKVISAIEVLLSQRDKSIEE